MVDSTEAVPPGTGPPEVNTKDEDSAVQHRAFVEALIPKFKLERLLNQALLVIERAALPSKPNVVSQFLEHIHTTTNLGANDIYHWYMANHRSQSTTLSPGSPSDLKLNLIYPCTEKHIRKYSAQRIHMVHETSQIYSKHISPFIDRERSSGRLNWMYNIIEGRSEQEDVILRSHEVSKAEEGFLLLPDLNWDRETIDALHLLAIVERRDIASLRDLQKQHVDWLRTMQKKVLQATVDLYGDRGIEEDGLKLYVHYHPTYYHFHIHVVNVMLEAGSTQAVGKAFGLENLISQLELMGGGPSNGFAELTLTYGLGEESELWRKIFKPLKEGKLMP
ncbi:MAG: hypothetical protein Q9160_006712 [Pyrenula sp. 1 TL-2023]